MFNIVEQFAMFPPSKQALAQRLLAGGRSVTKAVPVPVSAAPATWFNRNPGIHNVIAPAAPWFMGNANGISGLGATTPVASAGLNLNFGHQWTAADFMGDANWISAISRDCGLDPRYAGGLTYTPPSETLMSEANQKWLKLSALRDNVRAVDTFMTGIEAALASDIATANALVETEQDALCGKRSRTVEMKRIAAFNRIKDTLQKVREYAIPAAAGPGTAPGTGAGAELDAQVAAQLRANRAASNTGAATAAPGMSPAAKAALAFGGIALVGAAVFYVRRRG